MIYNLSKAMAILSKKLINLFLIKIIITHIYNPFYKDKIFEQNFESKINKNIN